MPPIASKKMATAISTSSSDRPGRTVRLLGRAHQRFSLVVIVLAVPADARSCKTMGWAFAFLSGRV